MPMSAIVDVLMLTQVSVVHVVMGCLFAIVYFYIMVFLGVQKRKQNQTSQVTIMMKAKLESKVAKTELVYLQLDF